MEKYGVEIDDQKKALLCEEATLMSKLASLQTAGMKLAQMGGDPELQRVQTRISEVRSVINKLDKEKTMQEFSEN
jgi:hypothetical protein